MFGEGIRGEHDPELSWLAVEDMYDPLRGHPRFEDLLRRIGLPPSVPETTPASQPTTTP